jgi:hypothetical protein
MEENDAPLVSEPCDKRSPLAVFPPEPPYTDAVPVCELATDEKVTIATMQQNVTMRRVIILARPTNINVSEIANGVIEKKLH